MDATSNATNQPTWDDYWKVKKWGYTTSYTGTSWDLKEDLRWDLKEVLTSKRPFFGVPCSFSKVYILERQAILKMLMLQNEGIMATTGPRVGLELLFWVPKSIQSKTLDASWHFDI